MPATAASPIRSAGDVQLAFCWSHCRRQFFELATPPAPIASEALQRIAELYQIEGDPWQERR